MSLTARTCALCGRSARTIGGVLGVRAVHPRAAGLRNVRLGNAHLLSTAC